MPAILSNRNYNAGTYPYGPVAVPLGIEYVKLSLDVTDMLDPANVITFAAQVSQDGGVTWKNETVRFQGGPIRTTDMGGNPIVRTPPFISYHIFHLPNPENANRRAKVDLIVEGPRTKIGADFEVL
jgi:hypothetical protein